MTPTVETAIDRPTWKSLSIAPITTHEEYVGCASHLKLVKAYQKRVTEFFSPHKARALAAHRGLCDEERNALERANADEVSCKAVMVQWDNEQERLRKLEEARLAEAARQQQERDQLELAAELESEAHRTGDFDLLQEATAVLELPVSTPTIFVQKATPKVAGISYREVWKFRVTDPAKVPREYLSVDEVKIGGVVRALKNAAQIPGVEVYREKTAAAGGAR